MQLFLVVWIGTTLVSITPFHNAEDCASAATVVKSLSTEDFNMEAYCQTKTSGDN